MTRQKERDPGRHEQYEQRDQRHELDIEAPHLGALGVLLFHLIDEKLNLVLRLGDRLRHHGGREHLSWKTRLQLGRTRYSVSAVSLFMATDLDVRAMGLDSGNYWHYSSTDIESIYRAGMDPNAMDREEVPGLFLTCTTLTRIVLAI